MLPTFKFNTELKLFFDRSSQVLWWTDTMMEEEKKGPTVQAKTCSGLRSPHPFPQNLEILRILCFCK